MLNIIIIIIKKTFISFKYEMATSGATACHGVVSLLFCCCFGGCVSNQRGTETAESPGHGKLLPPAPRDG